MPPNPKGSNRAQKPYSTRQGAGTAMLPAVRFAGRQYFNFNTYELINDGMVEVKSVARRDGFVCPRNGKLRHMGTSTRVGGCGTRCECMNCLATPRKYENPLATVETCPCIRCQRRRASPKGKH